MINLRNMELSDIEFGLQLCRLTHWNQLENDWRNLFAVSPQGVFIAEYDGVKCATASAVNYGTKIGWIGMVLVHPDFRRKGIASALMNKCIEHLHNLKVETIKLDATDQGKPVYAKLGFMDEQIIYRSVMNKQASAKQIHQKTEMNWEWINKTDLHIFGADRSALLKTLSNNGHFVQMLDSSANTFGYGFARLGFDASYIGPLIASDPNIAEKILTNLLVELPSGPVYIDTLSGNKNSNDLVHSIGFKVARELTRMYLGSFNDGITEKIYSVAGFELG